jgi:hypothetical protein
VREVGLVGTVAREPRRQPATPGQPATQTPGIIELAVQHFLSARMWACTHSRGWGWDTDGDRDWAAAPAIHIHVCAPGAACASIGLRLTSGAHAV